MRPLHSCRSIVQTVNKITTECKHSAYKKILTFYALFDFLFTSFFSWALYFEGFLMRVFWARALIFTLIFLPVCGSIIVFFVTFGMYLRLVARSEWLLLFPVPGLFPDNEHTFDIIFLMIKCFLEKAYAVYHDISFFQDKIWALWNFCLLWPRW